MTCSTRPCICALLVYAAVAVAFFTAPGAAGAAAPPAPSEGSAVVGDLPARWKAIAADIEPLAAASRKLLLGNRDPNGTSCIGPETGADMFMCPGGGVGTGLLAVCHAGVSERSSPTADFAWHQTTFKAMLQALRTTNGVILPKAVQLAERTERFAGSLRALTAWPQALAPSPVKPGSHWLGYCAGAFDAAAVRGDLAACQTWSAELASAAFTLADLHRWLDFLLENQLTAIAFQARCKPLFEACEKVYAGRYEAAFHPTYFPAGRLTINGPHNLLEVEHQAEWLFRIPNAYLEFSGEGALKVKRATMVGAPASVWMPPHLRGVFARLRTTLSPANQGVWDEAAHTPFRRSFMANMLYRASRVGAIERLALVLKRFNRVTPEGKPAAMMDVLFYRGGDLGAGIIWNDRFHPHLMSAASTLGGTDEQVLLGAQHFTRAVFGDWEHYGKVTTLGEALLQKRLDCIRATDMVGTLYRNAGRAGYYTIRWSAGVTGHTVAAAEVPRSGGPAIAIVDGLDKPQTAAELWPYAYLSGQKWPAGYTGIKAPVHAVELFTRGLDDYVWVEGYVVRGPDAGTLIRASVPYLPNRPPSATLRVRR